MAQEEARLGIASTYYFRIPNTWHPPTIARVRDLGHEVGLHYEALDKTQGDLALATQVMHQDLQTLREIAAVTTAAMHGNPLTVYDNRDFWATQSIKDFGLLGEAYLSVDFSHFHYFSDTGRSWLANHFNIYDAPVGSQSPSTTPSVATTNQLIAALPYLDRSLYLVTHPERWSANIMEWSVSWAKDFAANRLKVLVRRMMQTTKN